MVRVLGVGKGGGGPPQGQLNMEWQGETCHGIRVSNIVFRGFGSRVISLRRFIRHASRTTLRCSIGVVRFTRGKVGLGPTGELALPRTCRAL